MQIISSISNFFREVVMQGQPVFGRVRRHNADILTPDFAPLKATPFEQTIINQFKIYSNKQNMDALVVRVRPFDNSATYFTDPVTQEVTHGTFETLAATWKQAGWCQQAHTNGNREHGYLAMILDLKGQPPEKQIPGWRIGTMEMPDRFLQDPVISASSRTKIMQAAQNENAGELRTNDLPASARTPRGRTIDGQTYAVPGYLRAIINGGPKQG